LRAVISTRSNARWKKKSSQVIDARLAIALETGCLVLPDEGIIAVVKPPPDASLADLPTDRCVVIDGFKPTHELWRQRGFLTATETEGSYAAVIVELPRAKAEARNMIARAMEITTGPIAIDGQKTCGVDSILKDLRSRVSVSAPVAKAHGKLFCCMTPDPAAFEDWRAGPALTEGGFWTAPGVFSADAVDPASALLAAALPDRLGKQVADLGAGWGYLSAHVLTRPDVEAVHLVEAEHMALKCARRNVTDARAVFHWADATRWRAPEKIDTVVMNPPFHTSRTADPDLGRAFVQNAARLLTSKGQLWMVANRHLPYEKVLETCFKRVSEIAGDARFKLFHASGPLQPAG
jgi:16S rRNA (guanine1207-N2)-methyltransferase